MTHEHFEIHADRIGRRQRSAAKQAAAASGTCRGTGDGRFLSERSISVKCAAPVFGDAPGYRQATATRLLARAGVLSPRSFRGAGDTYSAPAPRASIQSMLFCSELRLNWVLEGRRLLQSSLCSHPWLYQALISRYMLIPSEENPVKALRHGQQVPATHYCQLQQM